MFQRLSKILRILGEKGRRREGGKGRGGKRGVGRNSEWWIVTDFFFYFSADLLNEMPETGTFVHPELHRSYEKACQVCFLFSFLFFSPFLISSPPLTVLSRALPLLRSHQNVYFRLRNR